MNRLAKIKAGESFKKGEVGFYNYTGLLGDTGTVVKFDSGIDDSTRAVIATKKCAAGETIPWSRNGGLTKLGMPDTGDAGSPLLLSLDTGTLKNTTGGGFVGMTIRRGVGLLNVEVEA